MGAVVFSRYPVPAGGGSIGGSSVGAEQRAAVPPGTEVCCLCVVQDGGVGEEAGGARGGEGAAAAGAAAAEAGRAAAHLHRPRVRAAVPRDGRAPGGVPAHRYCPQNPAGLVQQQDLKINWFLSIEWNLKFQ